MESDKEKVKKSGVKEKKPKGYQCLTPAIKEWDGIRQEWVIKREMPFGDYEWKKRDRDDGKEWQEMDEEDKEVFKTIAPDVVEEEKATNQIYVYLTYQKYERIRHAAKMRMSDRAIRAYAGLYDTKFKRLLRKYPLLRDRIDTWREELVGIAAMNVAKDVIENGNVENSKWVLERLDRDNFGKKSDVTVSGEVTHKHAIDVEQVKELRKSMASKFLSDKDEIDDSVIDVE